SPSAPDLLMLLTAPPHTLLFVVSTAPAPTELYSLSLHDALPISHVDRVGVACQGQAVIEVGAGLVALDLAGFDPGVEESDLSGDAVLFGLEQVQRYGSGVVGLEQFGALVVEAVAFEDLCFAFGFGGGEESVELAGDQLT